MKISFLLMFSLLIPALFLSCHGKSRVPDLPPLTKDEISGERLWQRITEEQNYTDYPSWPDYEGLHRGQPPHGRLHQVFINPVLRNALPIESRVAPNGSIIVKENYTSDEILNAYTVMAKVEGYDPDRRDWFWAKYDAEGNVMAEGMVPGCIDCHSGNSNNDCLILWPLDWPVDQE